MISARNCIKAKIKGVAKGAILAYVRSENGLNASVPVAAADRLALAAGKEAYFIFKAPSVIIVKDEDMMLSAQNQLPGVITSIEEGAVNCSVTVKTDAGDIVGMVTKASRERMDLKPGDSVSAVIKASSMMVGVKQ